MTNEQMIQYINKFNVATFAELRTWDEKRLANTVLFIKQEIAKGKHHAYTK